MSCTYEEDLTAYVDGELPQLRARSLENHLPGCQSCPPTLALLRRTVAQLEALPAVEPSGAMRPRVLARLAQPAGLGERLKGFFAPRFLMPALGMATAAAVAVVLSSGAADHKAQVDTADQLLYAQNKDVLEDLDVVGLEDPGDVEVVAHLDELMKEDGR